MSTVAFVDTNSLACMQGIRYLDTSQHSQQSEVDPGLTVYLMSKYADMHSIDSAVHMKCECGAAHMSLTESARYGLT